MAQKYVTPSRMLEKRVVTLFGDIDADKTSRVADELMQLQLDSSEPAHLLISSEGGDGDAGMGLHDFIAHVCAMEVRAVVTGKCQSAATFILLACPKRFALPHARFLIHSGTASGIELRMDNFTSEKLEQLKTELEEETRMVAAFYKEKLGASEEDVAQYLTRGDQPFNGSFSAEEALNMKLITEIVTGKLPFFLPAEGEPPQQ